MNYGRQGIKQKKKLLNSAATRLRTKLGVFAIKFILILAIAVVVSGSCLVLGSVQGIISSAPEVSTITYHLTDLPQKSTITKAMKSRRLYHRLQPYFRGTGRCAS